MSTQKTDWKRMIEGKLYNSASKDIFWQHAKGMYLTQKLNKCPIWNVPRQNRILNRLIPSSKGKSMWVFTPFYCEYGVNIHVGNDVFSTTIALFWTFRPSLWKTAYGSAQTSPSPPPAILWLPMNESIKTTPTAITIWSTQSPLEYRKTRGLPQTWWSAEASRSAKAQSSEQAASSREISPQAALQLATLAEFCAKSTRTTASTFGTPISTTKCRSQFAIKKNSPLKNNRISDRKIHIVYRM